MENNVNKNPGHSLGVAALITSIVTIVMALIPCIGMIAIIPGIVAIVLAVVGISQANRANAPRGMMVAALIIGIVASFISLSQYVVAAKLVSDKEGWKGDWENAMEDVRKEILDEFDREGVSIKIQKGDESVEIKASGNRSDMEKKLEILEGEVVVEVDTIKEPEK